MAAATWRPGLTRHAGNTQASGRCSNDVNDAIAAALEEPQESGKYRRGLPLGVVKQHNSATICFDPSDDELKLLSRRHRIPVARP